MPIKQYKPQFTAWSFSRLYAWEECPLRAKLKLIDKKKEPEGPALARGNAIHKEAEGYASGQLKTMPDSLTQLKDDFNILKKCSPLVEQQWAFTVEWQPTDWFGKDAWLRVICDAVTVTPPEATVIDHKTGKLREGYNDQVELFALATLAKFQDVHKVTTELWYLDHGKIIPNEFERGQEKALRKKWEKRAKPMLLDTTFAPRPGFHCRYCHFSKSKGGPCKY